MKKISEPIVFFGSGPVAARSLELLANDFNIDAVITKPAKTRKNDPVPVIDTAANLGINTYMSRDKKELMSLLQQKLVKSRLAVLIDYGIIVPQSVIDYFPLGIINSHFSLLPKWRGADPITFSILSGDTETGVSLMLLSKGMDEGPLLTQDKINITNKTDSNILTEDLIQMSHHLLVDNLPRYLNNELVPRPQDPSIEPSYSRKLTKLDGKIDWRKNAMEIEREIRAYIGWPKSYTKIKDIDIIITKAHAVDTSGSTGQYSINKNEIIFFCNEGGLSIDRLKPSGKSEMDCKSFLAGYRTSL